MRGDGAGAEKETAAPTWNVRALYRVGASLKAYPRYQGSGSTPGDARQRAEEEGVRACAGGASLWPPRPAPHRPPIEERVSMRTARRFPLSTPAAHTYPFRCPCAPPAGQDRPPAAPSCPHCYLPDCLLPTPWPPGSDARPPTASRWQGRNSRPPLNGRRRPRPSAPVARPRHHPGGTAPPTGQHLTPPSPIANAVARPCAPAVPAPPLSSS